MPKSELAQAMSPEDYFTPGSREWYEARTYGIGKPSGGPSLRNALVEEAAYMAPVVGEALSARDSWDSSGRAVNALQSGDYGQAASEYGNMLLGLFGAIPGAGIIARGTKRGAAWMDKNLPPMTNRLLDAMAPQDAKNTVNIFAGPNAKTADRSALAKAMDLQKSGASRDDIWRDTGWFQGTDGKWRFEIDDSGAELTPWQLHPHGQSNKDFAEAKSFIPQAMSANDWIRHPELERAYWPMSEQAPGVYYEGLDRSGASYRPDTDNISMGLQTLKEPGRGRASALHELQHAIQEREGFTSGTSPRAFPVESQLYQDVNDGRILSVLLKNGASQDAVLKKFEEVMGRQPSAQAFEIGISKEPYHPIGSQREAYERNAGEVEARNVEARQNMTAQERRATPPWKTQSVQDSLQIVGNPFSLKTNRLIESITPANPQNTVFSGVGLTDKLPMDEASRMSRAQEQGYRVGMPLYHGTASDIKAFDLSRGGQTSRSRAGSMGVSVALDPETASEFADLAAGKQGNGQNIVQLLHRADRPAVIQLDGTEKNLEIAATLSDLWDNGYDAVMLRNYTTPGGKTGQTTLIVKDPSQLRSPNAKFDPKNRGSSNLLAGAAGASLIAPAMFNGSDDQ